MVTELTTILGDNLSHALGWTIVHSLWQVALIALCMSMLHQARGKSAEQRYNISVLASLSVVLASAVTFSLYYSGGITTDIVFADTLASVEARSDEVISPLSFADSISAFFYANLDRINLIWGAGVALFALRMIVSMCYIKYLRHTSYAISSAKIVDMVARLQGVLGLSKMVRVAESAKVSVPMVIGHIKPLILIPVGIVTLLETEEIEAILIHEMSHIRRHDYLVNIGLTMIEIIYYFHPAMWWISANIKSERENCCDDAALDYGTDPVLYAKALVRLEEFRKSAVPSLAIPFISDRHQLLNRIKRILNMEQTKNDIREKSVSTIFLLVMAVLFSTTINSQIDNEIGLMDESAIAVTEETNTDKGDIVIAGNDEIVAEVRDGKIAQLSVDGKNVDDREIVDELQSAFSAVDQESLNGPNQTFVLKGNPRLEFEQNGFRMFGDEAQIMGHPSRLQIKSDTLPGIKKVEESEVTIIKRQNDRDIEITRNNGKITKLKIDGKLIPESEYGKYQDDIDDTMTHLRFSYDKAYELDIERLFPNGGLDSIFSQSFGMIHDGENWRQFGGNLEHLLNEDFFEEEDIEAMRALQFEDWNDISELKMLENMDALKELEGVLEGELKILKDLDPKIFRFDGSQFEDLEWENFGNLDAFRELQELKGIEDFGIEAPRLRHSRDYTVVDRIGDALQRDGLLEAYKLNKIELSGKHLKINGDKMPKSLYNKYKEIYQNSTGAPLTKSSKLVFEIKGEKSNIKKW